MWVLINIKNYKTDIKTKIEDVIEGTKNFQQNINWFTH